jgi:hypothetical protein
MGELSTEEVLEYYNRIDFETIYPYFSREI